MPRFETRQARGGWWVRDVAMQQWTACADETEAGEIARMLEEAAAAGHEAIRRESLQWVRGETEPSLDHATLLPPRGSSTLPPSDTETARDRR